jgi:hypothetical protein
MGHPLVLPLACALALGTLPALGALDVSLSLPDIERALAIARSSEAERARFHGRYRFALNDPTVTQVEVITEFRRVVIVGEDRLRRGDWMFTQGTRAAEAAVQEWHEQVAIAAQLRFNPLNTYVTIPSLDIMVSDSLSEEAVAPLAAHTTPQFSLPFPVAGKRGATTSSLVGAVLETDFQASAIGQTKRRVSVLMEGKELARTTIDFAAIE